MNWFQNLAWIFILLLVWETVWKSLALWQAARHSQKAWYIALLLLNTVGILPIVYLQFFQKTPPKK
jgi:hypothetical protein